MRKNRMNLYYHVLNSCLIEYLMFSKNIEKQIQIVEKNILDINFVKTVLTSIDQIAEDNAYPKECIENLKILIKFYKKRINN